MVQNNQYRLDLSNLIPVISANYLNNLSEHIFKLLTLVNVLSKHHSLSKFVYELHDVIHSFYLFLKQQESGLIVGDLSTEKNISQTLLNNFSSRPYFEFVNRNFKFYKDIIKNSSTLTFAVNLGEIYESCIKILYLIFLLSHNQLIEEEVNDVLFAIKFELYNHIVPTHFEDNADEWGLLHQLEFLKTTHI